MKNFANRLRHARELRRLTQSELARAANMSQSAIANYENGTRKSTKSIFKLAQALHLNPQWLAEGVLPMEPAALAEPLPDYEKGAGTPLLPWPFLQISPQEWESLPLRDRQVVEHTITALLRVTQNHNDTF